MQYSSNVMAMWNSDFHKAQVTIEFVTVFSIYLLTVFSLLSHITNIEKVNRLHVERYRMMNNVETLQNAVLEAYLYNKSSIIHLSGAACRFYSQGLRMSCIDKNSEYSVSLPVHVHLTGTVTGKDTVIVYNDGSKIVVKPL